MTPHVLKQDQYIDAPLEIVFPFFSRPENLERLTPDFMGMKVLTPQPIPMYVGAIIDYSVSVNGIPMRWTTCISEYDPPHRFVDVQLKGPYSFWHHTHTFESEGNGTRIHDEVRYLVPFGPIGAIAHHLMIKRQLNTIFSYRRTVLDNVEDWTSGSGIESRLTA